MTQFGISTAIMLMALGMMTQAQADVCHQDLMAKTQGDLDTLQGCGVYTGTLTIDGSGAEELELKGINDMMEGTLILNNNNALRTFTAPGLTKVHELRVINHTLLAQLNVPLLIQADTLMLSVLPALQTLDFPAQLSLADHVHIEDTHISPQITGFKPQQLKSFVLVSNNYLQQFDASSVKKIDGPLRVASNGIALDFQANQLTSIQTGEFRNVARLAMPQLQTVQGDLTFHDNEWSDLVLDGLERVEGTLALANNDALVSASFAHLNKVGGALAIGNNKQLMAIDGFPQLTEIDGTVDLAGHFDTYTMPVLSDVRGGMRLQTTSNKLQCADLERHMKKSDDLSIVKGQEFSCGSNMDETQLEPTLGQEEDTSSGGAGAAPNTDGPRGMPLTNHKGLARDANGSSKSPASDGQQEEEHIATGAAAALTSSSLWCAGMTVLAAALFGF
ncbi:hypothetical protein BCR42DRAFT_496391 [Absidia repens]|uniref:Receptor L-domain domain-containing protein n=1 Tax=Absidia repens TaxID=90262 RepID=A0A1X2I015_9FUNG|nr:hypothetical protein BCR42DRAFT_496391 [Absidia repens]